MKKGILLAAILFVLEATCFYALAVFFHFPTRAIFLFGGIYFLMLFFFHHYHFNPKLIWQEIVDLLKIHTLYMGIALIISIYEEPVLVFSMLYICVIMFIIDLFIERQMRRYLKRFATRILVLGAGQEAKRFNQLVLENNFLFVNVTGYVDLEYFTKQRPTRKTAVQNKLTPLHKINEAIRKNKVEAIYIIEDDLDSDQLDLLSNSIMEHVPVIKYHPASSLVQPYNTNIEDLDGDLYVSISDAKYRLLDRIIKKCIDLLFGLLGCIVLIPITIFVKILFICTGDYDSIFFTQPRIGLDGEIFKLYKFRSMIKDAEKVLDEAMERDPKIKEEYLTNKKLENDPRITKAGNFIRKTSLDEVPQFLNVIKGDMSLIGPRPYLEREIDDMGDAYKMIIKSKPGITGIWQANGRNNIGFADRCKLDVYYYENWSITLDIIIIVKTIKAVLFRDGAK